MVSTRPPISKYSCPFYYPNTISIIVSFTFHSFSIPYKSSGILLFIFFQFYSVVSRDSKVYNFSSSLFLLFIIIKSGRLAETRWSVCMSKSHRSLSVILKDRCWVVHIPFVRMVKFKFLHNSQWITLPTLSLGIFLINYLLISALKNNLCTEHIHYWYNTHTHTHTHTYIYIYFIYIYVCVCVCVHSIGFIFSHIYIYIYIYIYTNQIQQSNAPESFQKCPLLFFTMISWII